MAVIVPNDTIKQKDHLLSLEWLRFLLGIYIVFYHTFHYQGLPDWVRKMTEIGFYSTSTFFVLSGFLLAHVYLKNHTQPTVSMKETPRNFLVKRFSNLYPIHIGSLLITLAVVSLLPVLNISPEDSGSSLRFVMYDVNNPTPYEQLKHYMDNKELIIAFIMNFLLIHAWNPFYLTFNAPAWSISTLFGLYLLFPYIAPRLHRVKSPLAWIGLVNLLYLVPVLIVIYFTNFGMPETGILHRNPFMRLPEFAAGILLCALYHRQKQTGYKPSFLCLSLLVIYIGMCLYGASFLLSHGYYFTNKGNASYYLLHNGLLLTSQLALIYVFLAIPSSQNKKFITFSQKLGSSSLPMFALHIPLFVIFSRTQKVLSGDPALCLTDFMACMHAAGPKEVIYYPLFLVLSVYFCIVFQDKFVVFFRKKIQARLIKK